MPSRREETCHQLSVNQPQIWSFLIRGDQGARAVEEAEQHLQKGFGQPSQGKWQPQARSWGVQKYYCTYVEQLQELKEKNEFLVTQNEDQLKILENFQMRVSESFDTGLAKSDGNQLEEEIESDNKLK